MSLHDSILCNLCILVLVLAVHMKKKFIHDPVGPEVFETLISLHHDVLDH